MATSEQITAYKTSDGAVFSEPGDANKHQQTVDFYEWFRRSNPPYGGDGPVSAREMFEWLTANRAQVMALLES